MNQDKRAAWRRSRPSSRPIHRARAGGFIPAAGAWGRGGSTMIDAEEREAEIVGEAVTLAWQRVAALPPRKTAKTSKVEEEGRRRSRENVERCVGACVYGTARRSVTQSVHPNNQSSKDATMTGIRVGSYVTHSLRPAWGVGKVFGQSLQHILVGFSHLPEAERFKRMEWRPGLLERAEVKNDVELDSWKVECDSTCHTSARSSKPRRTAKAALWTREEGMERSSTSTATAFPTRGIDRRIATRGWRSTKLWHELLPRRRAARAGRRQAAHCRAAHPEGARPAREAAAAREERAAARARRVHAHREDDRRS